MLGSPGAESKTLSKKKPPFLAVCLGICWDLVVAAT
jgi:hypothetical protein